MTHFIPQKLATIGATIGVRAEYVEHAQRATSENIYSLERIISTALPLAYRQIAEFEDYLGEPMPSHLHDALLTEIGFWERLRESLADYREAEPNSHDEALYAKNVRQFLALHRDVVMLAEEIVTSCLSEHYTKTLDALRYAASQVPL